MTLRAQVDVPYGAGYEYVITDALNEKKLSLQEKVKLAKPGLAILEELEALAAEAKEKGGAQVPAFLASPSILPAN